MRHVIHFLVAALALGVPAMSRSSTNEGASAVVVASVADCVARLERSIGQLDTMIQAATNDESRVNCLNERKDKLKGLATIARASAEAFSKHLADSDNEAATEDKAIVFMACERGDKMFQEASECDAATPPASKKRNQRKSPMADKSTPRPRIVPVRDLSNCLRQARLASLILTAKGLDATVSGRDPFKRLSEIGIEPLGGWQPEECVTVDSFCVVLARALHLTVDKPEVPYSYVLAVRRDGWPIDTVLPSRRELSDTHLLVESEVRRLLASGYVGAMSGEGAR